jgi:hypothetical protein
LPTSRHNSSKYDQLPECNRYAAVLPWLLAVSFMSAFLSMQVCSALKTDPFET